MGFFSSPKPAIARLVSVAIVDPSRSCALNYITVECVEWSIGTIGGDLCFVKPDGKDYYISAELWRSVEEV